MATYAELRKKYSLSAKEDEKAKKTEGGQASSYAELRKKYLDSGTMEFNTRRNELSRRLDKLSEKWSAEANNRQWRSAKETAKFRMENEAEKETLLRMVEELRRDYGDDKEFTASLNKAASWLNSGVDFDQYENYWAQWGSQRSYDNYVAEQKAYHDNYGKLVDAADFATVSRTGLQQFEADRTAKQTKNKDESLLGKIGRYLGGVSDTSLPMSNVTKVQENYRKDTSYIEPQANWTDEQRNIYGYLYQTDRERADQFAQYTNNQNNAKEKQAKLTAISDWASKNGLTMAASTVAAIASMPLSLADTLNSMAEYNARGTISEGADVMPGEFSTAITGAVANTLNQKGGTLSERIPVIGGKGWGDVYQLGTSIAQSMLSAHTQGGLGTYMVFFGSSTANGIREAKNRGANDDQAITYGIMSGLAEAAGEALSVEHLINDVGASTTMKQFFRNVLVQGGIEASEEGMTTLINNFSDQLIMKDKSNFNIIVDELMRDGMSEKEAKTKAWLQMANDLAFDMLGGFVSGGVSGGIQGGIETAMINREYQNNAYGQNADLLVQEALEINPGNTLAQDIQSKLDSGEKVSGLQVYDLVQQNEAAMKAQDLHAIQTAAAQRLTELGETGDINTIATALTKRFSGEKLSRSEKQAIINSQYGSRVSHEMNPANVRSGDYSSVWAAGIGTNRINANEYNMAVEAAQEQTVDPQAHTVESTDQMVTGNDQIVRSNDQVVAPPTTNDVARAQYPATASEVETASEPAALVRTTETSKPVVFANRGEQFAEAVNMSRTAEPVAPEVTSKPVTLEEAAKQFGDQAGAMMHVYNIKPKEGQTVSSYTAGFDIAYKMGQDGVKFEAVQKSSAAEWLSPEQLKHAYDIGVESVKVNKEVTNNEGAEAVRLWNGAQWYDGASAGGELQRMGEGAGSVQNWGEAAAGGSGFGVQVAGNAQGQISARELGLPNGTSERNIRLYSGKETSDIKQAKAVAKEHGMDIVLFEGGNLTAMDGDGNTFEARAFVNGNKMYVRADHKRYSAAQLARHEAGHNQVDKGEVDTNSVYDRLVEMFGEEYVVWVVEQYATAYSMSGMTAEQIFEEILCDSLADMNAFDADTGPLVEYFLQETKRQANAEVEERKSRGPPTEKSLGEVQPKFSMERNVEQTKDLIAVHNLKLSELEKTLSLGGLPMPSIAIIKAQQQFDMYGEVSLVFAKDTIDPKKLKSNKVYGGDAWTPVYPAIEYKANEKVRNQISKKYHEIERKHGNATAKPLFRYVHELEDKLNSNGGEAGMLEKIYDDTGIMQIYLADTGIGVVEPITREIREEMKPKEKVQRQTFIDTLGEEFLREFKKAAAVSPTAAREFRKKNAEQIDQAYINWMMANLKEDSSFESDTERLEFAKECLESEPQLRILSLLNNAYKYMQDSGAKVKTETDVTATHAAIKKAAANGYKEWVDNLFKGAEEKSGIRNNVEPLTRSGARRSWEALHWENNLENVIKVMKGQDQVGADAFVPQSAVFSLSAKQYGSIADIKRDSYRLSTIPESEYEAIRESYAHRLAEIAGSIVESNGDNPYIEHNNTMELIVDAIRNRKTKSGMLTYMQQWNKNVTAQVVDDIVALVSDISEMPTGYFEAKPQRAVGLEEIKAVVIPDNADAQLLADLRKMDTQVVTYEEGNEQSRVDALNSVQNVRFSRELPNTDSDGNKLSAEQKEYFKDSKVRDTEGNLLVMYHGTPNGGFTKFRSGTYFTQNAEYAAVYQSPTASSISVKKSADSPQNYKVYLNIVKPFDTRKPKERRIFMQEYYRQYGTGAPLADSGLPDWTDGMDLQEFIEEMGYDYDGLILDEGATGGYGDEVKSRGLSYVTFSPEQVKNVDNTKPTEDADIRYSRENPTVAELTRLNEAQKNRIEALKRELKRTTVKSVRLGDVDKVAKSILGEYQSQADFGSVRNAMKDLADYIVRDGDGKSDMTWDTVKDKAVDIARDIVNKAQVMTNETELETFKEIKAYLRNNPIALENKADIADFNDFRKRNFGRFKISKDGTPMDTMWLWLQGEFGKGFFPEDITHPADQLIHIEWLLTNMAPEYANPYKGEISQNVEACAHEIIDTLLSDTVRQTPPTFADKQADKLLLEKSRLIDKHNAKVEKLKESHAEELLREKTKLNDKHNAKIEKLEEKHMQEMDAAVARSLAKIKKLQQEKVDIKEHYKEARKQATADRKESAAVKKYRTRIEEKTKKLSNMLLKNSDKEHIPEALKTVIGDYLQSIDFSSKSLINKGVQTKKDMTYAATLDRVRQVLQNQLDYMADPEKGNDNGFYLDMPAGFAQAIQEHINTVRSAAAGLDASTNQVYMMNSAELADMDYILTVILHSVSQVNELMANAHFHSVVEASKTTIEDVKTLGEAVATGKIANFLQWDNTTPYYAFKRLGTAPMSIFEGIQDGWDKMAQNVKAVKEYADATYTAAEVKDWSKKLHDIKLDSGETIRMSVPQIMSLHCLIRREQAMKHLMGGGIRVGDIEQKGKRTISKAENYALTADDLTKITRLLNKRQIEVADKLQQYMNTVGTDWGNEVSMKRFGYRAFGEANYFPIQSDSTNLPAVHPDAQANDLFRLLNMSMTKGLNPKANNALVVSNIFDVFADHMSDMAKYNGLALPVLDVMKWYNYKVQTEGTGTQIKTETVQRSIEKAFGKNANRYVVNFVKDLNGVNDGGKGTDSFARKMISNYKVAAVAGNMRVALLQPTAYVRASAAISPQYLMRGVGSNLAKAASEAEKYSGIAAWKAMGFYDTNISRGVRDQIKHDDTVVDKTVEISMKGAELGDRMTWGALWNACKIETRERTKLSGDELMEATAKRFRDIIYRTQVVDSTMTRSQTMRDTKGLSALTTAFMAEPTLSFNMLLDAYSEYDNESRKSGSKSKAWRKCRKSLTTALTSYVLTSLASSVAASLLDALRDDDEYEAFLEKYQEALSGNVLADLNPLSKLPIIKDVLSFLDGYDNSRMDTEWAKTLVDVYEIWAETINLKTGKLEEPTQVTYYGNMTLYGKIYKSLKALSQLSGLPISNVSREVATIWNNTFGGITGQKLKTYDPGSKSTIQYAYQDGKLTAEEAIVELVSKGVVGNKNDAFSMVKTWETGGSVYTDVYDAAIKGESIDKAVKELTDHGYKRDDIISRLKSEIGSRYRDGQITKQQATSMLKKYIGMANDDVTSTVNEWTCKVSTGIDYASIDDEFMDGNITASKAIQMYERYGGYSRTDAETKVQYLKFKRDNPDINADSSWIKKYYDDDIASSGLAIRTYVEYRSAVKDITGEGKKERRMAVIDSLPISNAQKDILYYSEGWTASRIHEAPWH